MFKKVLFIGFLFSLMGENCFDSSNDERDLSANVQDKNAELCKILLQKSKNIENQIEEKGKALEHEFANQLHREGIIDDTELENKLEAISKDKNLLASYVIKSKTISDLFIEMANIPIQQLDSILKTMTDFNTQEIDCQKTNFSSTKLKEKMEATKEKIRSLQTGLEEKNLNAVAQFFQEAGE